MIPPLTIIGRIAKKHGYRGEVSLELSNRDHASLIKKGDFLFLHFDGKGVPFFIESFKASSLVIKLQDVETEAQALQMEGLTISLPAQAVPKSQAQQPDWLGFEVHTHQGLSLGPIIEVHDYPQGPMLEVGLPNQPTRLIPWVEEWIIDVQPKKKTIVIQLPEGFLDI